MALREVFFGEGHGHSHVVLCNTPSKENEKPLPISSVFQDAMDEIRPSSTSSTTTGNNNAIQFSLLDCTYTLPTSGKTIAQKFNLNLQQRPTIFVSSPKLDSNVPKQIPSKHLKTGHMLAKVIKSMLLPHTQKIESSKDLKNKCLNTNYCALLLKGETPQKFLKDAIQSLLQKYGDNDDVKKQVSFASVDSATMYVLGLEEFIPEFTKGEHRFVMFKKVSGGIKEGDKRLITSMVSLSEKDVLSHNSMEDLIKSVINGKNDKMKKLSSLPQVKTRTKKLEESERAKRQRKSDASKKKKDQATKHSGENDGSKEGRKAERERRREEHKKNDPNYKDKTPEEIQEMERQRRQKMEEEAAKWNIGAEDDDELPEEGDGAYDDGEEEYIVEDGDDDEDIMDLD